MVKWTNSGKRECVMDRILGTHTVSLLDHANYKESKHDLTILNPHIVHVRCVTVCILFKIE